MIARYTDEVRMRQQELRYAIELLFLNLDQVREGKVIDIDKLINLAAGLKRCAQSAGETFKTQRREARNKIAKPSGRTVGLRVPR